MDEKQAKKNLRIKCDTSVHGRAVANCECFSIEKIYSKGYLACLSGPEVSALKAEIGELKELAEASKEIAGEEIEKAKKLQSELSTLREKAKGLVTVLERISRCKEFDVPAFQLAIEALSAWNSSSEGKGETLSRT